MTGVQPTRFIRETTSLMPVPLIPQMRLHQARDAIELWERTEELAGVPEPPPFWAFAWAGGVALARYLLDNARGVRGASVLDVGSGCGVVAVAATLAGASRVVASDIDPLAHAAIALNAAVNGVAVPRLVGDVLGGDGEGASLVLAGDVFYDREMTERVWPFLHRVHAAGADVLVGDPGRAYLPRGRLTAVTRYEVPVPAALEGHETRLVTIWRLSGAAAAPSCPA